jgi:hypothetical protein
MSTNHRTLRQLSSLLMLWSISACADPSAIGIIKVVRGTVTIGRVTGNVPGALGTAILETDQITTGADGAVGVTFLDNSLLSLGPNSHLSVERFKFNSTTHEGDFDSVLQRGKLAVISGKIAKHKEDAMKVRTPSSIIGVRGTEFVVEVMAAQ